MIKRLLLRWLFPDGLVIDDFYFPVHDGDTGTFKFIIRFYKKSKVKWLEPVTRKKGWMWNADCNDTLLI